MNAPLHWRPGPGLGAISRDCSSGSDRRVGRGPLVVVTEPSAVAQRRAFCLRGRRARARCQWCVFTPGSNAPGSLGRPPPCPLEGRWASLRPTGPAPGEGAHCRPGGRSGSCVTCLPEPEYRQYPERPACLPRAVSFVRASDPQHRLLSFHFFHQRLPSGPPAVSPALSFRLSEAPHPQVGVTPGEEGRGDHRAPAAQLVLSVTTWLTRTEGTWFAAAGAAALPLSR